MFDYIEIYTFGFVPISLSDPDHTALVIYLCHSSAGVPAAGFSSYTVGLDVPPSLPKAGDRNWHEDGTE